MFQPSRKDASYQPRRDSAQRDVVYIIWDLFFLIPFLFY